MATQLPYVVSLMNPDLYKAAQVLARHQRLSFAAWARVALAGAIQKPGLPHGDAVIAGERSQLVRFHLPDDLNDAVRARCSIRDASVSEFVARAVADAVFEQLEHPQLQRAMARRRAKTTNDRAS